MPAIRTGAGTRLLHIGPHKTGTSAIQGALFLARERLAAQGVVYPGQGRTILWPILAVTGQPPLLGEPTPKISYWEDLTRQIAATGDQRVVLSSEFFCQADDATARRVITDLGGDRVHVVVTLRSLTRILPSQWQQYIQNGFHFRYHEWLEGILSDPPSTPTPAFWLRHRHDELVARWAAVVGKENLTVIVIDESDRLMLLRVFESMLGLPDGFLVPEETAANRSLTAAEAELVRQVNEEFSRREWPQRNYSRFMRYGVIEQMKNTRLPSPGEPRIATPAWALARAADISAEMAASIEALGLNIVGDLSALGKRPAEQPEGAAGQVLPVEAAAQAVLGALAGGRAGGQSPGEATGELSTRSLAQVLAGRFRQRARRLVSR
ncbi:MAG TPA: hypothetical protein VGI96_37005 [Streptosporangiaceae bacterium]|jgi:hypothetical protein